MIEKIKKINYVRLLIIIFLTINLIFPLIMIFTNIFSSGIGSVYKSKIFISALKNSITYTVIATFISIGLAYLLAFLINRSTIRFKAIFTILLTIPMLIPSISHGTGLLVLFGRNGFLTNLLNLNFNIQGFSGLIIGSVMYSFPVALIMFTDIFSYEDKTLYEAADVLGIPKTSQFTNITMGYITKPLITVILAVFTMIFTDYGVPMMVGGTTTSLPLFMYQEVVGLMNYGKGVAIGLILLVPAVIGFILDLVFKKEVSTNNAGQTEVKVNKVFNVTSYIVIGIVTTLILLPIISFVFLTFIKKFPIDLTFTFSNIIKSFEMNAGRYLFNSILVSVIVSIIGMIVSYLTAYTTTRTKSKSNNFVHLISILSLAIPGILLGLSYVMFFNSTFIYNTFIILVIVNIIHFFGSPYIMAYNAMNKMNENYENVAQSLGIPRYRLILDVFIPANKNTILEMISYFFVNSMITISAVSLLTTSGTKLLSLLINDFEIIQLTEGAAFVSLLILSINLIIKGTVYIIKRRGYKNEIKQESI